MSTESAQRRLQESRESAGVFEVLNVAEDPTAPAYIVPIRPTRRGVG